jgi:hypothetical protein
MMEVGRGRRGEGRLEAPPLDPRAALRTTLRAAPSLSLALGLVIAASVLVAYRGSLDNGLVDWDDDIYLRRIPQLHAWTWENVRWMLTDTSWFYWHPLTYFVHAAEITLWQAEPKPFHFVGVALHTVIAIEVLVLAAILLAPRLEGAGGEEPAAPVTAAFLAALLFALHPLRVESVAWIAETKDLLCSIFYLASLLAWLAYGTATERPERQRWYAVSFALFVLALAAKPIVLTAPVVFLVLDVFLLGRAKRPGSLRGLLLEKAPFLACGVVAAVYGASGAKEQSRASVPLDLGAGDRMLTPLWGFAAPLVKTLWPVHLCPFEPQLHTEEISLGNARYLLSAVLLCGLAAHVLVRWRKGEYAWAAAGLAYLAAMVPVSGIRQIAGLATADRFSYLPTIPLYVLAGAGILGARRRAAARFGTAGVAGVTMVPLFLAGLLAVLTVRQVEVWRDPGTLWARVREKWPGRVPVAHINLGAWYFSESLRTGDQRFLEKAGGEFEEAVRMTKANPAAENNLGRIYETLGRPEEALRHYQRAVEQAPRYSFAHMNLARFYASRGDLGSAERHYRAALETGGAIDADVKAEVERLLGTKGR